MYDLSDLGKWRRIPGEGGIEFPTAEPRRVRLELLAGEPTGVAVKATSLGTRPVPIGWINGYEVVSFWIGGPFRLVADGPGCVVWTPELEGAGAIEIPEAVSFTTMMNRRERNPQLELMMQKMSQNVEKRIRQVERDLTFRFQEERRVEDAKKRIVERARKEELELAAVVESPDEDEGEAEPAAADAGDGDGLQKRGVQLGRPPLAKKRAASR